MLIEYIERLRKEPPEVRRQAVFFWTLVVVGLIVVGYLFYIAVDLPPVIGGGGAESGIARPYGE